MSQPWETDVPRQSLAERVEEARKSRAEQMAEMFDPTTTAATKLAEVFERSTAVNAQLARFRDGLSVPIAQAAAASESMAKIAEMAERARIATPPAYDMPAMPALRALGPIRRPEVDLLEQLVDAQQMQAELLGKLHEHQVQTDRDAAAAVADAAGREKLMLWLTGFGVFLSFVAALAGVLVLFG